MYKFGIYFLFCVLICLRQMNSGFLLNQKKKFAGVSMLK